MQTSKKSLILYRIAGLFIALLFAFAVANAFADETKQEQRTALFDDLASAETELDGRLAENELWNYWFDLAPTPEVRDLLDAAIERREAYDFEAAENILNEVVKDAPDYAEGYNQRAFIRFLRENYTDSQQDLEIALKLEPKHFGALAGLYQVYFRTGRQEQAFNNLQEAVKIHPWIRERGGLPKKLWPESYRRIHEPSQEI